nr:gastrula zinc finger protein XlCGF58.1 [Parasteatoda tepidariorum]
MLNHTGERPYRCRLCPKGFTRKDVLKAHMIVHSNQNVKRRKSYCGASASMTSNCKSALNFSDSNPKKIKTFTCSLCAYSSLYKQNYQRHMLSHAGDSNLKKIKTLTCSLCAYSSRNGLSVYFVGIGLYTPIEGETTSHKCAHCTYVSAFKSNLTRHVLRVHAGVRPYVCDVCGKSFTANQHLKAHYLIHTGEYPFRCEVCQKRLRTKHSYNNHLLSQHQIQNVLTRVGISAVQIGVVTLYRCNFCTYKSNFKGNLLRHMRSHTGERPFQCGLCGKSFIVKHHLKAHFLTHKLPSIRERTNFQDKETDQCVQVLLLLLQV